MKKYKFLLSIVLMSFLLIMTGCSSQRKLLILNWGEYINEEVVELFEQEFNVKVSINLADSNELFYAKMKAGTTAYDIVVPQDYMVEKMYYKNLLHKIDLSKLSNYDPVNNPFMPGIYDIQNQMFEGNESYGIPYFWGTFGLMYNKNKEGLEEAVLNNGWKAFFDESLRPAKTRVGMYDVPRFAYAAAMLGFNDDPNRTDDDALNFAFQKLTAFKFNEWGTDTLKKGVVAQNLDLAFVYTGDFLDMLYIKLADNSDLRDITFDIYIPDETIAFADELVIPKNARHIDLAYEFINFMLRPEIAYLNASVVGYCTPLLKAYEQIVSYTGDDEWLTSWAYANKTYYPILEKAKGTPLANLEREHLNKINNMINNVKAKWR